MFQACFETNNSISFFLLDSPIVHPLVDPRTSSVCLLTKDPQREYKDLLETHNIKFISRVVGLEKLKGKFKAYEARRMLLKENGLFLADDRIIPLLPKLLGSKWFDAKKYVSRFYPQLLLFFFNSNAKFLDSPFLSA